MLAATASPALAEVDPADLTAYVHARAADADGNAERAAAGYARALTAAPDNPIVAVRAYRAALSAGDMPLVARARAVLERADVAPGDTALIALATAVRANDEAGADAALARIGAGPLDFLVAPLSAWSLVETDPARAVAALEGAAKNPIGKHYAGETRALVLIASGRTDDGVALLRVVLGGSRGSFDLRITAAQLLAGQGRADLAAGLLAGDDPTLTALRESLGDGIKPSFAFGVSRTLIRLAGDLGDGDTAPLSIAMARSALLLEPDNDRARLLLAGALLAEDALPHALATLDGIAPASPYFRVAQTQRIALLDKAGRDEQALAAAAKIAAGDGARVDDLQRYGDQLAANERFDEAARVYARATDRAGDSADWVLYLQHGSALDRAGKWPQALPLLEKAVALAPDQPLALNYLGYGQLEHDGDVAAARALLERARMLKPDNLSILDSLAWAYFRSGDTAKALPLLERAAQGEPANGTINEHLGDVYWRAGRRYEARYAWRAASVHAEGDDAQRLAAKIADGPKNN
ncbi:MAG: tetratricopeptide repeat protein [Sphingomonas sp.]|nr:tetratricopeptide repeat protein [Sphingomonas sp.]